MDESSIDFFHLVCAFRRSGGLSLFLEIREFFFDSLIVDWEAELDHSVDTGGERWRFIEREAWGEQSSVEKQPDEISDSLVASVLIRFLSKLDDDAVIWVDFHSFLGDHVVRHGGISE